MSMKFWSKPVLFCNIYIIFHSCPMTLKVGVGYHNEKGVTCLHNAVCSGNEAAVAHIVEQLSGDVNRQDIDGW